MRTAQPNSPTRSRLLDAAQRLMLAKGFAATRVDEICTAAKLTKGSFFHYFDSKETLGKAVLERFCATSQEQHRGACRAQRDPLKRVYGYVDVAIQMSKACACPQGCLLGTFAQELSDTHPEIRAMCADAFGRWAQALQHDLDAAKARYAPARALDTKSLAQHFIAILEGSLILAKAQEDPRMVEKNLHHFKAYLKSLFGR